MILVFLGSWKQHPHRRGVDPARHSHLHLRCWARLGQTLNTMTLGGLALAVGILVDDATVTVENIYRNLHDWASRSRRRSSTGRRRSRCRRSSRRLSICVVFVSVVFLTGPAKFLFTPLALAVVFAMLASYLLSRTLVPVMTYMLLRSEAALFGPEGEKMDGDMFWNFHKKFDKRFEAFATKYAASRRRR